MTLESHDTGPAYLEPHNPENYTAEALGRPLSIDGIPHKPTFESLRDALRVLGEPTEETIQLAWTSTVNDKRGVWGMVSTDGTFNFLLCGAEDLGDDDHDEVLTDREYDLGSAVERAREWLLWLCPDPTEPTP